MVSFRDLPRVPWKPNTTINLICFYGQTIDLVSKAGHPALPRNTTLQSNRCNLRLFVDKSDFVRETSSAEPSNFLGAAPNAKFVARNSTCEYPFSVRLTVFHLFCVLFSSCTLSVAVLQLESPATAKRTM